MCILRNILFKPDVWNDGYRKLHFIEELSEDITIGKVLEIMGTSIYNQMRSNIQINFLDCCI